MSAIYDEESGLNEDNGISAEQFDIQEAKYKQLIQTGETTERMLQNEDVKKILCDLYMNTEIIRLVSLLGVPMKQDGYELVCQDLRAISTLRAFLDCLVNRGKEARSDLEILETNRFESLNSEE